MENNQKLVNSYYLKKLKYESDSTHLGAIYIFDGAERADLETVAYLYHMAN